jgi:hypothetical protein
MKELISQHFDRRQLIHYSSNITQQNMNHKCMMLAVAIVQPIDATKVTSTWHRNYAGPDNLDNQSLEKRLHAKLIGQVSQGGHERDLVEEVFVGPGVLECSQANCTFEVDASLGCADPCQTRSAPRMYEYPFDAFSMVSDPYYDVATDVDSGDGYVEPCFYRSATDINTWSPEDAVINEGCTARCTGCTFAGPIVSITGPALLQCNDGRCTKYVHGETFDCGTAIEEASEAYGMLATLPDGENVSHNFYGFEGINGSVEIPVTCSLECTGCEVNMESGNTPPTESTSTTSAQTETTSATNAARTEATFFTNQSTYSPSSDETYLRGGTRHGKAM